MENKYYPIANKYSWRPFIRQNPKEYKKFRDNYKELKIMEEYKKQSDLEEAVIRGYN